MWNNITEPNRPQVTTPRTRTACWIPKATKNTLRTCTTHCFYTATMVALTHLNVTSYVHSLSSCYLNVYWKFLLTRQDVLSVTPFINRQKKNHWFSWKDTQFVIYIWYCAAPLYKYQRSKVLPRKGHEGQEGEQIYSSTFPSTSALDGGGWSTPRPGRFTLWKDPVPIVQEDG